MSNQSPGTGESAGQVPANTPEGANEFERWGRKDTGTTTCSECGTIHIRFDPPLHFETRPPGEQCAAIKPGTYTNGPMPVPVCDLIKGHDGQHMAIIEYADRWN